MLWIKAFHIFFMVTWFSGLFYLPRLFVYHAETKDEIGNARFKVMERKLYIGIMTPGAIFTLFSGVWLLQYNLAYYKHQTWMHAKLILVAALIGYHLYLGKLLFAFRHDRNTHSHVFYRWLNEVPIIFLIGIVSLAIVNPYSSTISKSSLVAPHSGHCQVSGTSSQRVPAAIPSSGQPFSSS